MTTPVPGRVVPALDRTVAVGHAVGSAHRRRRALASAYRLLIAAGAIVSLTGLVIHAGQPRCFDCGGFESNTDITRIKIKKYAFEAYPAWATAHPDRRCPDKLSDLNEYMNNDDSKDAWGRPLASGCDHVTGRLWVASAGEDRTWNTDDDLWSDR